MVQAFSSVCALAVAASATVVSAWPTSTGDVEYSEVYVVAAGRGRLARRHGAEDKIIQHNGYGHVNINGFYAENFGKLYRSCGTCGDIKRTVYLNHVWGNNPENALVTVNSNNGDVATFTDDIHVHSDEGNDDIVICKTTAATDGDEPEVTSTGVSKNCVYDADAIEYY
ncbi:hypothetical protein PI125_g15258 [Phytophthora idaei]|nr:hypothetical protein PI125_g15258 [Phytophthora idaei]